jgi:hypothetical protein
VQCAIQEAREIIYAKAAGKTTTEQFKGAKQFLREKLHRFNCNLVLMILLLK